MSKPISYFPKTKLYSPETPNKSVPSDLNVFSGKMHYWMSVIEDDIMIDYHEIKITMTFNTRPY